MSLCLTIFRTGGKIVFNMSILSLVCLGNVVASDCISYRRYDRLPRVAPVIQSTLKLWVLCVPMYVQH